jgi:hypothetical protein
MATLKELRDLHEEVIEMCYSYCDMLQAIVDDDDEPQTQRDELNDLISAGRDHIMKTTKVLDHLMSLKEQPE